MVMIFWETNMGMFGNYTYKAEYPLQYVFTDHAFLDVFIVDEETRSKTFRIWLTIFIDVYSRSILGFDLNTESPSIESITSAFRNSILEKNFIIKKNIISPRNGHVLENLGPISLDNAWAHRSHTFEELARFLEISLEYRPPYKSRYGAIVERAIGNIQGKIKSMFPGGIVTPAKKGKINAFDEACLTMNDIYEMVLRLIVNYQNHPHSSLKQTPNDVWNRGIQTIPPHPVMMTPELERKLWYLLPGEKNYWPKRNFLFWNEIHI